VRGRAVGLARAGRLVIYRKGSRSTRMIFAASTALAYPAATETSRKDRKCFLSFQNCSGLSPRRCISC
jgi:hypothetical protein